MNKHDREWREALRDDWIALQQACGGICVRCRIRSRNWRRVDPTRHDISITMDHIVPRYYGGLDTIDNIQPLCFRCNVKKGLDQTDYRPENWRELFLAAKERRERRKKGFRPVALVIL